MILRSAIASTPELNTVRFDPGIGIESCKGSAIHIFAVSLLGVSN